MRDDLREGIAIIDLTIATKLERFSICLLKGDLAASDVVILSVYRK